MTKPRKYTGNKDPHPKARPGTIRFQETMGFLFGMKNLGIFANRPVRGASGASGKAPLSVHATGRAADLGGTHDQIVKAINFLFDNRYELGIEEIHDYGNRVIPGAHGAGYRCDRDLWKAYDKPTIGSPGAGWVHYEITPELADNPARVDAAFKKILDAAAAAQ